MEDPSKESSNNVEESKAVDIDDLLEEVQSFGCYQYFQVFLIGYVCIAMSMYWNNFIFTADNIDYRCSVPECEESDSTVAIPIWWPNNTDHRCSRPVLNDTNITGKCSREKFSNSSVPCDRWIYENENSIVETFDLACKPWMRTLVGTAHNLGLLVGNPILGYFSDRYGRKKSVIFSVLGTTFMGLAKSFSFHYIMFVALEFLEALASSTVYITCFVLLIELSSTKMRILAGTYLALFLGAGKILLVFVVQAIPYWKTWVRVTYSAGLAVLIYFFVLSDSLRWLIVNGKMEMAKHNILTMSKWNKTRVPLEKLNQLDKVASHSSDLEQTTSGIKEVLCSPIILKRLTIASFWWGATAFVYYGIAIMAVELPGNKYMNFTLTTIAFVPGGFFAPLSLNYLGRKKTCLLSFVLCGACCIASGMIPESMAWLSLGVFLLGALTVATAFDGIYIYSSELFPTCMRASLMGWCSMAARIGSSIAPQTPLLESVFPGLHLFILGVVSLMAAFLMTLTPETLNRKLPDTIQEAEELS